MNAATETLAPAVPTNAQFVGRSPAGVQWMCYPKAGDTHTTFWNRFETMRRRLETLAARS
jgi:hypothetical protein